MVGVRHSDGGSEPGPWRKTDVGGGFQMGRERGQLHRGRDETPVLWPPHAKGLLTGKDPDVERDWGQEEKGMTEDEMAGWHHCLDGHEFESR